MIRKSNPPIPTTVLELLKNRKVPMYIERDTSANVLQRELMSALVDYSLRLPQIDIYIGEQREMDEDMSYQITRRSDTNCGKTFGCYRIPHTDIDFVVENIDDIKSPSRHGYNSKYSMQVIIKPANEKQRDGSYRKTLGYTLNFIMHNEYNDEVDESNKNSIEVLARLLYEFRMHKEKTEYNLDNMFANLNKQTNARTIDELIKAENVAKAKEIQDKADKDKNNL